MHLARRDRRVPRRPGHCQNGDQTAPDWLEAASYFNSLSHFSTLLLLLSGVVCRILLETFHAFPCKGTSADPPCSLPRHHEHLVGQPHSGWAAATLCSNFQMQNRGDVRVGGCHQPQLRVEHAACARLVGVPCSTAFLIGLTWLIRPEAVVVRAFAQAD